MTFKAFSKPWFRKPAKPEPRLALRTTFALSDLKRPLRNAIIADRKAMVTEMLKRGGVAPLRPLEEIRAEVRAARR